MLQDTMESMDDDEVEEEAEEEVNKVLFQITNGNYSGCNFFLKLTTTPLSMKGCVAASVVY